MEGIVILKEKVVRLSDGKIFTPIIPDPELGYYKSLVKLSKEKGRDNYVDKNMVDLNPTRFKYIKDDEDIELELNYKLKLNFKKLREQKSMLIDYASTLGEDNEIWGIVHLLDSIQDEATDDHGISASIVFGDISYL